MTAERGTEARCAVLVVGAGPAGLMLGCELGLAGVDTMVIERFASRPAFCRGFNLNARSLELLDRRGIAHRFLAEGPTVSTSSFADDIRLDLTAMATDRPCVLGIAQRRVEELLEERAGELGVRVHWDHELIDLEARPDGVTAVVRAAGRETRIHAEYAVGCDGGRSTVRKRAGIAFPGTPARRYTLLGDVALARPEELPFGATTSEAGSVFVIPRPGYVRIITADPEPPAEADTPVTLGHLQAAVDRVLGRHVDLVEPRWLTRFGDAARQAERYVAGRVVLAGDAAHIHPPAGAVGVNVALADAMNLGWKLAATVLGTSGDGLLETYHRERHAAGARVLRNTRAQAVLGRRDDELAPLRDLFTEIAGLDEVNRYLAELLTEVGTRYDMGLSARQAHPWLGRLAPNLALATAGGDTSIAELLRDGRALLLHRGDGEPGAAVRRHPQVRTRRAHWADRHDVSAILVRPDGHVAWLRATDGTPQPGTLHDALYTWFGPMNGRRAAPTSDRVR